MISYDARIRIFESAEEVAREALSCVRSSIGPETFRLAVSGGRTPVRLYELMSESGFDWSRMEVFQVDERYVPNTDPNSNERSIREAWLSKLSSPPKFYPMVSGASAVECAVSYESILRDALPMDVAILGMGTDGHTASLFPGHAPLLEATRLVEATNAPIGVAQRISMTVAALRQTRRILFLVTGADKRDAMGKLLGNEEGAFGPAAKVFWALPQAELFCDTAAMG